MRKSSWVAAFLAGVVLGAAVFGARTVSAGPPAQTGPEPLTSATLKTMISNLGYDVKDLSNNKYSFNIEKGGLNIPLAAEVSANGNKVWLTAYLGELSDKTKSNSAYAFELLKQNGDIQPTQFYLRKDKLMVGRCLDNRGIVPSILRNDIDSLIGSVVDKKAFWTQP